MPEVRIPVSATLLDIVAQYPSCEQVIRSYDKQAGTCLLCNALFESVADVARMFGLDCGQFTDDLERAASFGADDR